MALSDHMKRMPVDDVSNICDICYDLLRIYKETGKLCGQRIVLLAERWRITHDEACELILYRYDQLVGIPGINPVGVCNGEA